MTVTSARRQAIATLIAIVPSVAAAADYGKSIMVRPAAAKTPAETPRPTDTVLLRHRLTGGETVHYEVTHVAKTKTRINKREEVSQVHTVSQRRWTVTDATDEKMTFEHQIDSVAMTQQTGEAEEIRWDSRSGDDAPPAFEMIATNLGDPLAKITINGQGQELDREHFGGSKSTLGTGGIALVLPPEAVKVGASWAVPTEIQVRDEAGLVKTIKLRQLHTLTGVSAGIATIQLRTQTLTPINEESIKAQVVQQLNNGEMRFDIDRGVLLERQLDWDETVVGFRGNGSMMEYRAKLTERMISGEEATEIASRPVTRR